MTGGHTWYTSHPDPGAPRKGDLVAVAINGVIQLMQIPYSGWQRPAGARWPTPAELAAHQLSVGDQP